MAAFAHVPAILAQPFLPAPQEERLRRWKWIGIACTATLSLWLASFAVVRIWARLATEPASPRPFHEPATPSGLAVLVHGWTKGPEDMEEIAQVAREVDASLAIHLWSYDARRFSNQDPEGLAQQLDREIERLHEPTGGRVVLIGHSLGGLLVRRAYLEALRRQDSWAGSVDRILLLAAPNRGTLAISRSRWLAVGDALARSYGVGKLIQATYRGSPFVVNLRLDWIREFRTLAAPPFVAQVLGNRDKVVSAADSRDLLQFPNSEDHILPNSTHASVVRRGESGEIVRDLLTKRVMAAASAATAQASADYKILIVHGIRDYGERFQELRDAVAALAIQHGFQAQASAPRYQ